MGFSRQEYWSGLPCPPPGDLPNPGIKPQSPAAPALQMGSLLLSHWESPCLYTTPRKEALHIQHSISNKYMKLNESCDYLGAIILFMGFLGGTSGKEPICQCRRHKGCGFDPCVGKIPWRRAWQPTPVFLPGESHGQRSLAGYSPWGRKELDTAEVT